MDASAKRIVGNRYGQRTEATGRLRLAGVDFLNARPILHGLLQGMAADRVELSLVAPSEVTRRLIEGEADVGLAPLATLAIHGNLEVVPGIAIACDGPVQSVMIVGERPLEELDELLLDTSSRTSVILARLIARHRCAKEPRYVSRTAAQIEKEIGDRTGALVIGDAALRLRGRYRYELDLGQAWKEWTGLPFVFAVWAALPGRADHQVIQLLDASLQAGLSARREVAHAAAAPDADRSLYTDYLEYLTNTIRYELTNSVQEGANEFLRRAGEAGLLPKVELAFAKRQSAVVSMTDAKATKPNVDELLAYAANGGRLSFAEAMRLGEEADTHALGFAADQRRRSLHPEGVVTYIVDRNINYTNVCTTSCRFCAFYRPVGHREGYVLSREELATKIAETVDAGGIQILLQGGLNPDLRLSWYEDLFRWMKTEFPIALHALSPEEIWHLSRLENISIDEVLERLCRAGMDSLPGGGAEILTDRVRSKIAKAKCTSAEWLEVMRVAHRLGMKSSATMMFGTCDTLEDRVSHLLKIRDLQDETGGFTAFICWDYQHEQGTKQKAGETGVVLYLRMQALARLVLDNVPNIQSSWVTQGPAVGQIALRFGANDLGSTMFEENVVSSAGTTFGMDARAIEEHARAAGFRVARRNQRYELLTQPS